MTRAYDAARADLHSCVGGSAAGSAVRMLPQADPPYANTFTSAAQAWVGRGAQGGGQEGRRHQRAGSAGQDGIRPACGPAPKRRRSATPSSPKHAALTSALQREDEDGAEGVGQAQHRRRHVVDLLTGGSGGVRQGSAMGVGRTVLRVRRQQGAASDGGSRSGRAGREALPSAPRIRQRPRRR